MPSAPMLSTPAAFTVDGTVETSATSHEDLHDHGSQLNGCNGECTNENQYSNIHGDDLVKSDGPVSLPYGGGHLLKFMLLTNLLASIKGFSFNLFLISFPNVISVKISQLSYFVLKIEHCSVRTVMNQFM